MKLSIMYYKGTFRKDIKLQMFYIVKIVVLILIVTNISPRLNPNDSLCKKIEISLPREASSIKISSFTLLGHMTRIGYKVDSFEKSLQLTGPDVLMEIRDYMLIKPIIDIIQKEEWQKTNTEIYNIHAKIEICSYGKCLYTFYVDPWGPMIIYNNEKLLSTSENKYLWVRQIWNTIGDHIGINIITNDNSVSNK